MAIEAVEKQVVPTDEKQVMVSTEKQATSTDGASSPSLNSSGVPKFDSAAERRLVRKLDFRILPVLWILYLCNFIDRANVSTLLNIMLGGPTD